MHWTVKTCFLEYLQVMKNACGDLQNVVALAASAAEEGALATLKMKASAGRASYVEASQLQYPDPGAHAVAIILRAVQKSC